VFFCPSKSAPAFPGVPSCSFLFPRGLCRDCWEVGHSAQSAAFPYQRPVALVGVTGFEPAAFVPNHWRGCHQRALSRGEKH
jgi:hypothetical protein